MNTAHSNPFQLSHTRTLRSALAAMLFSVPVLLSGASCASTNVRREAAPATASTTARPFTSMEDTTPPVGQGVTSVYTTHPTGGESETAGTDPKPIEIPPPDVFMITGRSGIGDVSTEGDSRTLKVTLMFSLLTIHRATLSFKGDVDVILQRWTDEEWQVAGNSKLVPKDLKLAVSSSTKKGTGSGSHPHDVKFTLVEGAPDDYKTVPLRFTLKAKMVFDNDPPTDVTCCVAFPSQE